MAKLVWDKSGEHFYETGVSHGVLYVWNDSEKKYGTGVAWNGLTGVTESPSGADETALYADDIKYLSLTSVEEFGATITAYTYPDEFMACDGSVALADGVYIGQQPRKRFCFCYQTVVGNDAAGNEYGTKIHIIYGCTASPSDRDYGTINDSPEAIEFSWEITTQPIDTGITNMKPTSVITIDLTKISDTTKIASIKDALYGTAEKEPKVLFPEEIVTLVGTAG